nr:3-dehydroquinate synthase [Chlamydia serpentis]
MSETIITTPHTIKLVSNFFQKKLFSSIPTTYPLVIITDELTQQYVLSRILDHIKALGYQVVVLTFPSGEPNKTWETFISLQYQLVDQNITPKSSIIGIGGGIVLDMTGFLAATYCRGLPLYLIPTTITAMIDASIGGKNGINLLGIKNRLGTFYLPKEVWMCPEFLSTLPREQWHYGIAEAIKHAFIADAYLWEFLNSHSKMLFSSPQILYEFIKRNCQIKAAIVADDPYDLHIRKILNFGHSIAHAIETLSKGTINHGQAVSVGMMIETKVSLAEGVMQNPQLIDQLEKLLKRFELPSTLKELKHIVPEHLHDSLYNPENIIYTLGYDKKNFSKHELKMIMIEHLGRAAPFNGTYCSSPNMEILYDILWSECHAMCHG